MSCPTDWPAHYPTEMREPFEALLEKVLKRLDGTSRQMIAARLAQRFRSAYVNEFYLTRLRGTRNAEGDHALQYHLLSKERTLPADCAADRGRDFAAAFAAVSTAQRILDGQRQRAYGCKC